MKYFACALAFFTAVVCYKPLDARPIRLSMYYMWPDTVVSQTIISDVEHFRKGLHQVVGELGGAVGVGFEIVFIEPLPEEIPLLYRVIGGKSGIDGDALITILQQNPAVSRAHETDFTFIIAEGLFWKDCVTLDRCHLVSGIAESTGHWALVQYGKFGFDEEFKHTLFHELGHLVGLEHVTIEECKLRNLVMCVGSKTKEAIVTDIRDGVVYYANIQVSVKEFEIEETFRNAIKVFYQKINR